LSDKIRVAVLFGGRSAEHDVSILSAANVLQAIDRDRFEVVPIAINRAGRWFLLEDGPISPSIPESGLEVALLPGGKGRLVAADLSSKQTVIEPVDVVFPVLHGPFGEDGSVQGYAEIADVVYVGCGVFASAAAMDKAMAKALLRADGIPVARARSLRKGEAVRFEDLQRDLGPVLFIKPARQGSSVGVSRVGGNGADFASALEGALRHDDKVLIEAFVDGREIECSVLERGDGSLVVSDPGEIVTSAHHDFYSYDAKYLDAGGALVKVPADVPEPIRAKARAMAMAAFRALGCEGMARVDFFLLADDTLVVNELNTIPGFTNISMYAKALAASGISYRDLIGELIDHAMARHRRRSDQM
jgi:D-alanine-D-alanine ligase